MSVDPQPGDIITKWHERPRYVEDGDVVRVRDEEVFKGYVPIEWRGQYSHVLRRQIAKCEPAAGRDGRGGYGKSAKL